MGRRPRSHRAGALWSERRQCPVQAFLIRDRLLVAKIPTNLTCVVRDVLREVPIHLCRGSPGGRKAAQALGDGRRVGLANVVDQFGRGLEKLFRKFQDRSRGGCAVHVTNRWRQVCLSDTAVIYRHVVTLGEKLSDHVRSDKLGAADDQNTHVQVDAKASRDRLLSGDVRPSVNSSSSEGVRRTNPPEAAVEQPERVEVEEP